MTDKEYITQLDKVNNEELIKKLNYCGHDGYYDVIYYPILKELCKRLNVDFSVLNN